MTSIINQKRTIWHFLGMAILGTLNFSPVHAQQTNENTTVVAKANHVGLAVHDLNAEQKWYKNAFNMTVEQKFDFPSAKVRTVLLRAPNGLGIELIEREGASRPKEFTDPLDAASTLGYGHWALTVGDVNATFNHLISTGAKQVSAPGPAVQPGSRFAYVKDPEGNLIELIQLPSKK